MLKYNKSEHQKEIVKSAITSLRESINNARNEVNKKYLSKEITIYEMTNQLFIFDFFDKFLLENLTKNSTGLNSLLELYESFPFPTQKDNQNFNSMRFFLCQMIGTDKMEQEILGFESEGI
jgi:hypothetical protein